MAKGLRPGELDRSQVEQSVLEDYSVFQDDDDPRFVEDFYNCRGTMEGGDPLEDWRDDVELVALDETDTDEEN